MRLIGGEKAGKEAAKGAQLWVPLGQTWRLGLEPAILPAVCSW